MPMKIVEHNTLSALILTSASQDGIIELNITPVGPGAVRIGTQQDANIHPIPQASGVDRSAFRVSEISGNPIRVLAQSPDGMTPFSATSAVNLVLQRRGSDDGVFIRNIPVSGALSAPVVDIYRGTDDAIYVAAVEQVHQEEGIIGWFMAQRQEMNQPLRPVPSSILVDTSPSMHEYEAGVAQVAAFLESLFQKEDTPVTVEQRSPIPSLRRSVGHVQVEPHELSSAVMITDIPSLQGDVPALLVGQSDFPDEFLNSSAPYFVISPELLVQLQQSEDTYTTATFHQLNAMVTWLENLKNEGI